MNGVETASGEESDLVPLMAPGDKVVIRVVEGETSKVYTLTATINAPVISAVDAIAGSQFDNQTPMYIIDDSGMTGKGLSAVHDNNSNAFTMWHTNANPGASAWVQIDLGQSYALDEMWVWNMNQQNNIGRGLKNVKIEYSADGVKWQNLEPEEGMSFTDSPEGYPFQLAQGTGENGMAATNLNDGNNTPIRFDGAEARYVRITAHPEAGVGSWGDVYFGLSEVRFTQKLELRDIVEVASIAVSSEGGENAITTAGGSLQMTATVQPDDATRKNVTWSIGNPEDNVAVISEDGLLSARRNGTVEVVATATDGSGVTGTATVTVSGQPVVIEGVTAVTGDDYDAERWGANVTNDSGMSGKGSVYDTTWNDTNAAGMWHTNANPGSKAWIDFDLGSVQPVEEMWIWNMNQNNNLDRGLKNVKIEYRSSEDDDWTALDGDGEGEYDFTLAQGTGQNGMAATNLTDGKPVELNLETRYIRITADPENGQGNYGSDYYGLSEVRFTKQMTTEGMLDEAEAAAKNALAGMTVSNETTDDEILSAVQSAVGESVQVSWAEDFQMTPATYAEAGSITGSLELALNGENRTVDVGLVIPVILIKGDVTGDGRVAIEDVMAACRILARKNTNIDPDDDEIARGDVTKDGEITIEDIMAICRILAQQSV